MPQPLHFKWEWNLNASPLQLWPLVSDTNRFNRDAGLPSIERSKNNPEKPAMILRTRAAGMLIEWEETPFEWIAPFEFGVERIYKSGPIALAKIKVSLRTQAQGTHLIYESRLTPRNFIAQLAVRAKMQWDIRPRLDSLLKNYAVRAAHKPVKKDALPSLKSRELAEFSKLSPEAANLASYIETADPLDLVRIRPYALAREWNSERRKILEVFLTAAHQRLVEFQWEMICPHCRGSEKRGSSLEIISREGYCQSCDLHYTVNFDQLIELTFRPHPKIRKISGGFFCTGGPKVTPHIIVQKTAEPGRPFLFPLSLEPGLYRLRGTRTKREKIFNVKETGKTAALFKMTAGEILGPEEIPAGMHEWCIENTSDTPVLFSLEQMKWAEDRVPGSDVIHMRLFRDLFQTQCLRPHQQITSKELTLVFTDLKGSTKLYQETGDSAAFSQVMDHFDILQDAVNAHEGTVIKTIGDSVMAVFDSPVMALRAMASAQKTLAHPAKEKQLPLYLKVGIHKGANLMVNLNDRLDYFGSSVNIAARLVSLSSGKDIIISSEAAKDPETASFLSCSEIQFQSEQEQTLIKGFGKENFTLFRLTSKQ